MGKGLKPILLWYVWIRLVDGTWHRVEDIAKQLRISQNFVSWAASFLSEHGLAELGRNGEIRLHDTASRFEEIVKALPQIR